MLQCKIKKIVLVHPNIIDDYLYPENIFSRYGSNNFDVSYKSLITADTINKNLVEFSQFTTCIDYFNILLKTNIGINDGKNIYCTSGRVMVLFAMYVENKYDIDILKDYFSWCIAIDASIKNDKFVINKILQGF